MISFGVEKRRILGWAALLAPLPFAVNGVMFGPLLLPYAVAVALLLRRARNPAARWLPVWAVNAAAVAYLPVLLADFLVLSGGRPVGPVIRLLLYGVVVKLASITQERDKWQTLVAELFVFLGAMATSTHPAIVLYLVGFTTLVLWILARFAYLHLLTTFGRTEVAPPPLPLGRFLTFATLAILLLAGPLFAILPRLRSPYLTSGQGGGGPGLNLPGFATEVTLDSIGMARENPEVVLRMSYRRAPAQPLSLRFKAGGHEVLRKGVWRPAPDSGEDLTRRPSQAFELSLEKPSAEAEIWLQPVLEERLPVPVETARVWLDPFVFSLRRTDVGTLELPQATNRPRQFRVALLDRPVLPAREGFVLEEGSPLLDASAVEPTVAALAAEVAGTGTPAERAAAIERYLQTQFEYTTDFVGRGGERPLEDFLFRYKSGHCEYFASAMVMMLRTQGIPARLATGFLGADYNRLEEVYVVRQRHAHAWVEAYFPEVGWRLFDPTPADGRPPLASTGLLALVAESWEFLVFRWDRYVLSYGFADQARFLIELRESLWDLWDELTGKRGRAKARVGKPATDAAAAEPSPDEADRRWPLAGGAVVALVAGALAARRRRRRRSATALYRELGRLLARQGLPERSARAPLALAWTAARRFPAAAAGIDRLVSAYLEESFGERPLPPAERAELGEQWQAVCRAVQEQARRERPGWLERGRLRGRSRAG